jgi:transcriptional regulator with XRE-family HTH domain
MAEEARTNQLGKAVRIRRELLDLKRRDLADRAGLSYPYISEIENGVKQPSHSALTRIAAALDLEVSELAALGEGLGAADAERSIGSSPAPVVASPQRPRITVGSRMALADPLDAIALRSIGSSFPGDLDPGVAELVSDLVAEELERFRRDELPEIVRAEVQRILDERELDE